MWMGLGFFSWPRWWKMEAFFLSPKTSVMCSIFPAWPLQDGGTVEGRLFQNTCERQWVEFDETKGYQDHGTWSYYSEAYKCLPRTEEMVQLVKQLPWSIRNWPSVKKISRRKCILRIAQNVEVASSKGKYLISHKCLNRHPQRWGTHRGVISELEIHRTEVYQDAALKGKDRHLA